MAEQHATSMLVIADAQGIEGRGEVLLDNVRSEIERLRDALQPIMDEPTQGDGLALDSVEVALSVTLAGEIGIFTKGSAEAQASITVTFSRPAASA